MIGCIIQARVGSTRLPGKVNELIQGKTILEHLIERLKKAKLVEKIVIAVPETEEDKQLEEVAKKYGVDFFQGSEEDVLERYVECAKEFGIDTIARVCADSPLVSGKYLDETIKAHNESKNDYTSPEKQLPEGTWAEVVSLQALEKTQAETSEQKYKEHVTLFARTHPEKFRVGEISGSEKLYRQGIKLSIDTESDLKLVKAIVEEIGKDVSEIEIKEIVELFDKKPELFSKHSSSGKPYVSVMINTYNYGKTLEKAIQSALNQTMPSTDYEVIVVDDGSTDNTAEILKRFEDRIRVFRQENRGVYAATNLAFKNAKGKYVIKLDADDWFEETCLEKMFRALEQEPDASFAYIDIKHVKNGKETLVSLKEFDVFKTIACGIMFRKDKIIRANNSNDMYNEKLFFPEHDLLFKLIKKYNGIYVPKTHYNYRRHKKSLTVKQGAQEK